MVVKGYQEIYIYISSTKLAMAEEEVPTSIEDEEPEETPGYKPPAQKTLDEIQKLDAEDESLVRYKQMLLAGAETAADDDGGPNVKVLKMSVIVEGRPDIELDLSGDLSKLKEKPIVIKEGTNYKIKITFKVVREIVAGLKFHQVSYRKGIRVDKSSLMVGSYGPKADPQEYLTPLDEAPKGMLARGHYTLKSKFVDDDKISYLDWEWAIDIKKDWE